VSPGSDVGEGTVVGLGSVVRGKLPPEMICSGHPAVPVKPRH
jgi:putative colanic acid biosynthesis acetyltransferase WcaF